HYKTAAFYASPQCGIMKAGRLAGRRLFHFGECSMEYAARQFARRVLYAHLLALAVVALIVVLAAREVHQQASMRALEQATTRQELLAGQTLAGVEGYYASILADLQLRRTAATQVDQPSFGGGDAAARLSELQLARALWTKLETQASQLILYERQSKQVLHAFPEDQLDAAAEVVERADGWL